jgi:hypothetical protein
MRIPPPRDWTLFGRPVGEWLYLALMTFQGVNGLYESLQLRAHNGPEWAVTVGQFMLAVVSLGIVAATLAGRAIGLRLLWLFALIAVVLAPLATWSFGAPMSDIITSAITVAAVCVGVALYGRRRLHASITRRQWASVLAKHAAAADAYAATIATLTPEQWTHRPAPDAWTPADITEHLARTYSQYAGESRGKDSLRIRLGFLRLILARAFVKPRLLSGAPFPKAKAPRALRPVSGPDTPADGVALFRATGESCLRDLGILAERRPHRQLVHPYLGHLPLYDIVLFAAQHIRHHHRQLLAAIASPT